MSVQRFIQVKFQKEGIHKYPGAPDEVAFLRYPHRHMFHFSVMMEVFHDDRDIEFIMLKRELEKLYDGGALELDYKSCEMIADELYEYLNKEYPGRRVKIEIMEDDENGSISVYGF